MHRTEVPRPRQDSITLMVLDYKAPSASPGILLEGTIHINLEV